MSNFGYEELLSTAPSGQTIHCCLSLPHPDRQIRVLALDPVDLESPTRGQELHGRIHILNELTDHEYAALSYVWTPKSDPPIPERENRLILSCNGHRHEARIKPNCWSALWHLCKIQRQSTTILWVDSICIDQKNDEEKIEQIKLMCNIYMSAQKTYFWLGEAAAGTDEAMDFLSSNKITSSTGGLQNFILISIKMWWQLAKVSPYPHDDGLKSIFGREWIQRLWTLQESLLPRESILVCGEKSIPWQRFIFSLESIHYFHDHPWFLLFDSSYLPWRNLIKLTQWFAENDGNRIGEASDNFGQLSHQSMQVEAHLVCLKWAVRSIFILFSPLMLMDMLFCPLIGVQYFMFTYVLPQRPNRGRLFFPKSSPSILEELRNRKVWDPRDMYNGTVGILGGNASSTRESLHTVFGRLCANLIYETRSLDALLFANTYADDNYSSWVINWTSEIPHIWGNAIYYMDKYRTRSLRPPDGYNIESTIQTSGRVSWYCFGPATEYWCRQYVFLNQQKLEKYRGAMPATQPRWDFRDQDQSLCVFGLVLTHISSHLTPTTYADVVTPLHPSRRVLLSMMTRANFFLATVTRLLQKPFTWFSQKVTESPIQMVRPQDVMPTSEATLQQVERSLFISVLYAAFTRMGTDNQEEVSNQLTSLMVVATGDRRLERELRMWWCTLRAAAGIRQGHEWLEDKVLTDEYVWNSLNLVMHILQEAKLSAVGYEASRVLAGVPGGLAFAAAGAQTGDTVALISGMMFPLVLRPCGQGRFRLIGPIFLPGVMDGELENQVKRFPLHEILIV